MELTQVNIWPFGVYFIYKLTATRGIRGKTKGKVDELLVTGVPTKQVEKYCRDHKLVITNKAVYNATDMDNPLLISDGKGNYNRKD